MDVVTRIEHALIEIIQIDDGNMIRCSLSQDAERSRQRDKREENQQDSIEDKCQTLPVVRILNDIDSHR